VGVNLVGLLPAWQGSCYVDRQTSFRRRCCILQAPAKRYTSCRGGLMHAILYGDLLGFLGPTFGLWFAYRKATSRVWRWQTLCVLLLCWRGGLVGVVGGACNKINQHRKCVSRRQFAALPDLQNNPV
jgi:hypothetical protein